MSKRKRGIHITELWEPCILHDGIDVYTVSFKVRASDVKARFSGGPSLSSLAEGYNLFAHILKQAGGLIHKALKDHACSAKTK